MQGSMAFVSGFSGVKVGRPPVDARTCAAAPRRVAMGNRVNVTARLEDVKIERPSSNRRKISSSIIIKKSPEAVWSVLTDYNRLAEYIPNLAMSRKRYHPKGGIRLEQCGVQSIFGFEFKASVVMDMKEVNTDKKDREIHFDMVESRDFKVFNGVWKLKSLQNGTATNLRYEVEIVPRGFVPVQMVEWRIKEDIPTNLKSVKAKSESLSDEDMVRPPSPGSESRVARNSRT
mmetsp:Transcript_9288/g.27966  ORF Transcript_9288/g.27966 Transcript_9288/m.27966 type:complete len:231 (+) Transcript_9288:223-915(+)